MNMTANGKLRLYFVTKASARRVTESVPLLDFYAACAKGVKLISNATTVVLSHFINGDYNLRANATGFFALSR